MRTLIVCWWMAALAAMTIAWSEWRRLAAVETLALALVAVTRSQELASELVMFGPRTVVPVLAVLSARPYPVARGPPRTLLEERTSRTR